MTKHKYRGEAKSRETESGRRLREESVEARGARRKVKKGERR